MLTGTVVTGEGWHSKNMRHWSALPFAPFPGTLNIFVGEDAVSEMCARPGASVHSDGVEFRYWFGKMAGNTVAVTWNIGCRPGVLEILAPVRLRDLPLEDGDQVKVVV